MEQRDEICYESGNCLWICGSSCVGGCFFGALLDTRRRAVRGGGRYGRWIRVVTKSERKFVARGGIPTSRKNGEKWGTQARFACDEAIVFASERVDPRDALADDQRVDVVRAFVGLH